MMKQNRLKHHLFNSLLAIVMAFLLLPACSTHHTSANIPDFKISKTVLTETVSPSKPSSALKQPRTVFSVYDDSVASVIKFENLYGSHDIRWEWIDPDGNMYFKTDDFPLTSKKEKYIRTGTTWHELSIKGEPAQNMTGKWRVNIYLDGGLAATDTFYLSTAQDPVGLPPILNIKQIKLSSNVIEGNNQAELSVTLENVGPGDARDVYLDITCPDKHIEFPKNMKFKTIAARGGEQTLTIPVKGTRTLKDGSASIDILALEPNFKVRIKGKRLTVQTRKFRNPKLILAKFSALESESMQKNNQVELNEMVDVKIAVQNIGTGSAKNVQVDIINTQNGVMFLGRGEGRRLIKSSTVYFDEIAPGKFEVITCRYFVNSEFVGKQLEFDVSAKESFGEYGFGESRFQAINTEVMPVGEIQTVRIYDDFQEKAVQVEDIPDFVVDVDVNIPETGMENKDAVAVVIGNKDYRSQDVPTVKYAHQDARIISEYLVKTLGFQKKNIITRYNATISDFNDIFGTAATAQGVLSDYIKSGRSDVFIFYSGHGAPDLKSKTGYFVPVDCDPARVRLNGYSLDLFYKNVAKLPARQVTIVLDACFSGASGTGESLIRSASPLLIIVSKMAKLKANTICLASSDGDQVSSWYDEKKHGLFTYFFLKGIGGDADANADSRITYKELYDFVSDKQDGVPYYARRLHSGRTQTPIMIGNNPDRVLVTLKN